MMNYEDLYIQLCMLKIDNAIDYADKHKVKAHNSAMKKLNSICEEFKMNTPYAIEILSHLLNNENEQVRLTAASHCFNLDLCRQQAKDVLLDIQKNSKNKINVFNAEMVLNCL
ncbi:MAG: DUF2019 domain-containing protein [Acutalibacteraceae bacterium]